MNKTFNNCTVWTAGERHPNDDAEDDGERDDDDDDDGDDDADDGDDRPKRRILRIRWTA